MSDNRPRAAGKRTPWSCRCVSFSLSAFWIITGLRLVAPGPAMAQAPVFPNIPDVQIADHTLRGKAAADECFAYLASPSPLPKFTDPTACSTYGTDPPAKAKVNQSYIWGLTQSGDDLWFGTFANGNCVTQAGSGPISMNPTPYKTDSWVCEFGNSPFYPSPFPDPRLGDIRPPRAYQYSKSKHALLDRTPRYSVYVNVNNAEGILPLLGATRGIRAATTHGGLILLAGPNIDPRGGLTFFAWDEASGAFLGGRAVLGYNNIRQFLNLDGILYTAVGKNFCSGPICAPTVTGGRILRLNPEKVENCAFNPTGQVPNPPACFLLNGGTQQAPLPLTEVGDLNTVAGSLAAHDGRIFTVTWPSQDLPGAISSLYMSPVVPSGGLTAANASQWTQVWKASDYEPDPLIVQTYAGGAIASFDGYLFWGTLHIPLQAAQFLISAFPPATREEAVQDIVGTTRATVFLRGKDFDTPDPQVDLLYGNERLPVFTPPSGDQPATWTLLPNKTGKRSLWGPSGFGTPWNAYTWSAAVWEDRLWVGTLDWSFQANQASALIDSTLGAIPPELFATATYGADLLYFTSAARPAFPESTNGIGNPTTYGVRNELVSGSNLFLGMANAMNLLTDPADALKFGGLGGWELNELSASPNLNTPVGKNIAVALPGGVSVRYCSVTGGGTTFSSIVRNPFNPTLPVNPLLADFDLNGPELPRGITGPPSELVLLWSSARWGEGCSESPALGTVCSESPAPGTAGVPIPCPESLPLGTVGVPIPVGITAPRLLQMQWDGGQFTWHDITSSVDWDSGKIRGDVTTSYLGILGVAQANVLTLRLTMF